MRDGAPLVDTTDLRLADVVQISVRLTDVVTGQPYWWRRFACITRLGGSRRTLKALTLKLCPDMDKDLRVIDLHDSDQVVIKIPEERWPEGVVAIRMKLLMQGHIKLSDDS